MKIINFCIIAHIDHGKSTLADRMLEITNTVEKRVFKEQFLDQMDLERERGITIKLQPVRMRHKDFILNLIDTPGHVDFTYEVSRSLAAVEGAILLVDATSGIQAQTLANLYLAIDQNLEIIPVLNKIDLPTANVPARKKELANLLNVDENEILEISAKNGQGVGELLDKVIEKFPQADLAPEKPLQALIFDSKFDPYKGVIAFVRIMQGCIKKGDKFTLKAAQTSGEVVELGYFLPHTCAENSLTSGEIGYIATGLKNVEECRVGDTLTKKEENAKIGPLKGYCEPKPVVFSSFYPTDNEEFETLRDAIGKLKLNDAALFFEPEVSKALGRGMRCGFLGLLHMEIICERLEREFGVNIIVSSPTVAYKITNEQTGEQKNIYSPSEFEMQSYFKIEQPWSKVEIISPQSYIGNIMQLMDEKDAVLKNSTPLDNNNRLVLEYEIPLANVISDLYDKLKSVTSGFASMNYEPLEYRQGDLIKIDFLLAGEKVDAFSIIVDKRHCQREARKTVDRLKEVIPRQNFAITIQAAVGGKIIAREDVSAFRKDVTAKLYGGDITRKRKLLEKQKKGKKRMKQFGRIQIPQEVFLKVLKR
ncbi:MAG: translation elongation factor 4 [bacterium]